jgi:hypothetical protein
MWQPRCCVCWLVERVERRGWDGSVADRVEWGHEVLVACTTATLAWVGTRGARRLDLGCPHTAPSRVPAVEVEDGLSPVRGPQLLTVFAAAVADGAVRHHGVVRVVRGGLLERRLGDGAGDHGHGGLRGRTHVHQHHALALCAKRRDAGWCSASLDDF